MQNIKPLVLDLVEWIEKEPRPYSEVMDAWKTSCPRLTVWEDAVDQGYVKRKRHAREGLLVVVTGSGRHFLQQNGRRLSGRLQ